MLNVPLGFLQQMQFCAIWNLRYILAQFVLWQFTFSRHLPSVRQRGTDVNELLGRCGRVVQEMTSSCAIRAY